MQKLFPKAKKQCFKNGFFDLSDCRVATQIGMDYRVVKAAVELKNFICKTTNSSHTYKQLRSGEIAPKTIYIGIDLSLPNEGYRIDVTAEKIMILGSDSAGCFYGIETLKQLIDSTRIAAQEIEDFPSMRHRGFYQDVTRGRIPTLQNLKELVDVLASLKYNSLELYVEHTYDFEEFRDGKRTTEDYLTAEEILELDQYCYDRFIDFIPSLSTFGHLYELLSKEEYKHLCELENFEHESHFWRERMTHHTIDPSNDESFKVICSLIDQYLPLFRSEYFNICCDETFDLGKGRNQGKEVGELYIGFVTKIIEHVKSSGKKVMMWADIALKHPDKIALLPEDTILLNWDYRDIPNENNAKTIHDLGRTQIICPGVLGWNRLVEDINISETNIRNSALICNKYNTEGMLVTNWGDYGHPASLWSVLYGIFLGGNFAWDVDTAPDEQFETEASLFLYNCNTNVIPLIKKLALAHREASWGAFYAVSEKENHMPFNKEKVLEAIKDAREIYNSFASLYEGGAFLSDLCVSAKGILLFLQLALCYIEGSDKASIKKEFNDWYKFYADLWLRDNKQSELLEIKKFIDKLI